MRRSRSATRITRHAMTVLAALLLADGEPVTSEDMALWLFDTAISRIGIRNHIFNLRRFGVEIASSTHGEGYRLLRVPPDEHLESLLAMVPVVKRSDWWLLRSTCPIQRTA
jgi:biotin operon repressor